MKNKYFFILIQMTVFTYYFGRMYVKSSDKLASFVLTPPKGYENKIATLAINDVIHLGEDIKNVSLHSVKLSEQHENNYQNLICMANHCAPNLTYRFDGLDVDLWFEIRTPRPKNNFIRGECIISIDLIYDE